MMSDFAWSCAVVSAQRLLLRSIISESVQNMGVKLSVGLRFRQPAAY